MTNYIEPAENIYQDIGFDEVKTFKPQIRKNGQYVRPGRETIVAIALIGGYIVWLSCIAIQKENFDLKCFLVLLISLYISIKATMLSEGY